MPDLAELEDPKSYDELNADELLAELRTRDEQLRAERERANGLSERMDAYRSDLRLHDQRFESFKQGVTDAVKELIDCGTLTREDAVEFCEAINVPAPPAKYTVTVSIQLIVEGVEADNSDEAEDLVRNGITVDCGAQSEEESWDVQEISSEES